MNDVINEVTVVIPCYNHGEHLGEAVDSALGQAQVSAKVLIVDDGSTDRSTITEISRQARRDRVAAISASNLGPGAARNLGLRHVDGAYAIVLDADDRLLPEFASVCLAVLDGDGQVGIASTWIQSFGAADWKFRPRGGTGVDFVRQNECGSMAMIRLSAWREVGGYSSDLAFEDWDFYLKIVEFGWRIEIVESFLAEYRLNEKSRNTASAQNRPDAVRELLRRHRALFVEHLDESIVHREMQIADLRAYAFGAPDREPVFGDGSAGHELGRRVSGSE